VDWVLDRLGRELEALRGQLAALQTASAPETERDSVEPEDAEKRQDI